jgi:hypothetical protein
MHHEPDDKFKECIRECWECRTECQTTLFNHCLQEGGEHLEESHVKLMMDCIQICQTAADFMTRNSSLHAEICKACASVCEVCADSCEEIGGEMMSQCARACRNCAESCREMAVDVTGAKATSGAGAAASA